MHSTNSIPRLVLAISTLGCISTQARNESSGAELPPASTTTGLLLGKFPGETAYDKLWSGFTLYKDETNPILQEFSLQGRLQLQYADGHSSRGHFDIEDYKNSGKDEAVWGDHFEARRAYFGFKSKWFQKWKLEGQIDVDTDGLDGTGGHTLYKDIYDLYLIYAHSDALNIGLGKQEIKFSREQEISSKEIVTIERSVVTNLLHPGNLTGLWVNGKGISQHWLYEAGVYGNDPMPEFSDFNGGALFIGKIGYDYSTQSGIDSAIASFRYLHNTDPGYKTTREDPNFSFSASPGYSHAFALSNDIVHGRFGLTTDLLYGVGDDQLGQSDVAALNIIPSYFIATGLQAVGRLQLASSSDPDGMKLQSRYESVSPNTNPLNGKRTSDSSGNTYFSTYLGLNYYLHGHKAKLMTGVEYSHLGGGDYNGTTFYSGLRIAF
jgi:phosphate-selective porin OprO/OprP